MSNEEALEEEITKFYSDHDSREMRHNFISRMERKMHRKEHMLSKS